MTTKQGCGSLAIVSVILGFSIITSVANMCCICYFLQVINKVSELEHIIQELTSNKEADFVPEHSTQEDLYASVKRGLNTDDTNKTITEHAQLSQHPWRLTSIVTTRQKRDASQEIPVVKFSTKKCRRRNRERTRKCPVCQPKPDKVAAQYSGVASTDSSGYINFLTPSPWVTASTSPVFKNGSTFTIKAAGFHMMYAQVLFRGYAPRKRVDIIHSRDGLKVEMFRCQTAFFIENARHVTCPVTGVINARPGDVVRVRSGNKYIEVDTPKRSTYFGVVKLA